MEPSSFWAKLTEYGLAGVIIAILFVFLWRLLVWVMAWVDKINTQHNAERETWIRRLESLDQSIQLHNQSSIESRRATEEAHRYQKAEHEKLADQMNIITSSLKQTEQALGRINGYIKE